jgi:nicotinamide riboside kinase
MRIGFTGAHRSGKSTLAALVRAEFNLPFIQSPASAIAADYDFDMGRDNRLQFGRDIPASTGVEMQQAIFDRVVSNLDGRAAFVADRTPIDVAAYLLADATAGAGNQYTRAAAVQMINKAIVETQRLFDIVILVPPFGDYVAELGKPPENEAYQEHHHLLCRGILFDEDLDLYWDEIKRVTFSVDARMDFVRGMIGEWLDTPGSLAA